MKTTRILHTVLLSAALAAGCGEQKKQEPAPAAKASTTTPGQPDPKATQPAPSTATGIMAGGQALADVKPTGKAATVREAAALFTREDQTAVAAMTPALPDNALALMGDEPADDKGDFKLVVEPSNDSELKRAAAERLGKLLTDLNAIIKLPRDIPVVMGPCGEWNAFYNPRDGLIKVCDEFTVLTAEMFSQYKKNPADVKVATMNALVGAFLHEMGHALIHQWHLPAVGREEDAADQLAAILLISEKDETTQVVLDMAELWLTVNIQRGGKYSFWDEHSLDEQRFYNFECLVYGSNTQKYEYLITDLDLPLRRAVRCKQEYQQIRAAWNELLKRYLHEG